MEERQEDAAEFIGTVVHYFGRPQVGVIRLETELRTGDHVAFVGRTTDFGQEVRSMEVEHTPVESAPPGTEIAVQVDQRVRKGDRVYRMARS